MFGVPTFIVDDRAVFVRLLTRPDGNPGTSVQTIEDVVRLVVDQPHLNEFKHTRIPR